LLLKSYLESQTTATTAKTATAPTTKTTSVTASATTPATNTFTCFRPSEYSTKTAMDLCPAPS